MASRQSHKLKFWVRVPVPQHLFGSLKLGYYLCFMEYRKQENGKIISWDMFVEKYIGVMPDHGILRHSFEQLEEVDVEYDSTAETLKHIKKVNNYLIDASTEILRRAKIHDDSKLVDPEKMYFDEATPLLAKLRFGSPEYTESTRKLKPALDHHFKVNSHHPQYYENGVNGMNLFDLVEMFFDWKAAGERTKDGNIYKSIEINAERFGLSKQFRQIFENTADYLWKNTSEHKQVKELT